MVQAIISVTIQCHDVCWEGPVKQSSIVSLHWSRKAMYGLIANYHMNSKNSFSVSKMAVRRVEMDSRSGEVCVSGCGCWRCGSCSRANLCNTCACDATVYYCQHSKCFIKLLLMFPFSLERGEKQFSSFGKFKIMLDYNRKKFLKFFLRSFEMVVKV